MWSNSLMDSGHEITTMLAHGEHTHVNFYHFSKYGNVYECPYSFSCSCHFRNYPASRGFFLAWLLGFGVVHVACQTDKGSERLIKKPCQEETPARRKLYYLIFHRIWWTNSFEYSHSYKSKINLENVRNKQTLAHNTFSTIIYFLPKSKCTSSQVAYDHFLGDIWVAFVPITPLSRFSRVVSRFLVSFSHGKASTSFPAKNTRTTQLNKYNDK